MVLFFFWQHFDHMTVSRVEYFSSFKMAGKMGIFWLSFALAIIGSNAFGEFYVLYSPDSLQFSSASDTLESSLKEVFSASLGLSVEKSDMQSEWYALRILNPFKTPEAVVEVYIDGVASLGEQVLLYATPTILSKFKVYNLTVDEYEPDTFDAVTDRIEQRFVIGDSKLVSIKLSDADDVKQAENVFGKMELKLEKMENLQHLQHTVDEDRQFLTELETLRKISARVAAGVVSADNIIDFYSFRFRTLHALSDFHGPNSLQTKEAKKILNKALIEMTNAFVKAYDGSVLVTAVTTDVAHTRRTIRAAETARPRVNDEMSSDSYSSDYSAMFNIILWFMVAFTFSLIAIVYTIMDMDPGRDSIIYRMTSTRMKKE